MDYIEKILLERERYRNAPGSEYDLNNGPNDWVSIAGKYLTESCRRKGIDPSKEEFESSLIKAGAVILAALEHLDHMQSMKRISDDTNHG